MADREALRQGLKILKEGKVLGLFPEGTRSKDGKLGKGMAGVGFLLCVQKQLLFLVLLLVHISVLQG